MFLKHWARQFAKSIPRWVQTPRIAFYWLFSTTRVHGGPRRNQPIHAVGLGNITVAPDVIIGVFRSPHFFSSCAYLEARNATARVSIGQGTAINNGFTAIAEHTFIDIGRRVLIGTNVEIFDSDFHGLTVAQRSLSLASRARPVIIEDDVFIASNAKVLKGVRVGKGSVIANGAVVTKSIPAGVVAAGNPAAVVKSLPCD